MEKPGNGLPRACHGITVLRMLHTRPEARVQPLSTLLWVGVGVEPTLPAAFPAFLCPSAGLVPLEPDGFPTPVFHLKKEHRGGETLLLRHMIMPFTCRSWALPASKRVFFLQPSLLVCTIRAGGSWSEGCLVSAKGGSNRVATSCSSVHQFVLPASAWRIVGRQS